MFTYVSRLASRYPGTIYKSSLLVSSRSLSIDADSSQLLYLHVGPSGDCWIGPSIFAAKHLQPDYVKSIELPKGAPIEDVEKILEDDPTLARELYDSLDIQRVIDLARTKR
jgi:hypothetical protein